MENENNTNRLFIWVAILLILIVVGSVFYFLERSDISGKVTEEKLKGSQSEVMLQGENVNDSISVSTCLGSLLQSATLNLAVILLSFIVYLK